MSSLSSLYLGNHLHQVWVFLDVFVQLAHVLVKLFIENFIGWMVLGAQFRVGTWRSWWNVSCSLSHMLLWSNSFDWSNLYYLLILLCLTEACFGTWTFIFFLYNSLLSNSLWKWSLDFFRCFNNHLLSLGCCCNWLWGWLDNNYFLFFFNFLAFIKLFHSNKVFFALIF